MDKDNLPGFTAEHSLYGADQQFYARASSTPYAFAADIVPQGCIVLDGTLVCDIPRGPVPKPDPEIRCMSRCRQTYRGAALQKCLEDC